MSTELSKNYFELFGLPISYDIDRTVLDARYRELQRSVHPDRYARASEQERRLSVQHAANINEGYQILKNVLRRGRYLLELRGHEFNDEHNTTSDPTFLMEQMELRERLGEVRGVADPLAEISGFISDVEKRLKEMSGELSACLAQSGDTVSEAAVDYVLKMQFFRKLEDEASELEADLEDELL